MRNSLKKLLYDFEIIANLNFGDQIEITDDCINIATSSLFTPIYRTITKDSRLKSLNFIKNKLDLIIDLFYLILESTFLSFPSSDSLKSQERINWLLDIVNILRNSVYGLDNFKKTYSKDSGFKYDIDLVIDKINTNCFLFDKILQDKHLL